MNKHRLLVDNEGNKFYHLLHTAHHNPPGHRVILGNYYKVLAHNRSRVPRIFLSGFPPFEANKTLLHCMCFKEEEKSL